MKKFYLFSLLVFFTNESFTQALRKPIAAVYIGPGAYSLTHVDVFSVTGNTASLAQIKNMTAGVYGEKRYLLNATNFYSAIFALPTSKGNFAFQADYFGYNNYNESQIGIAYARSVGSKLDIGIKFNYYSFRIPAYQNSSVINFEAGAIAHLTDKLNAGIHIYNPVKAALSKTDNEKLSSIYTFGIGYEASDNFLISAEFVKEEDLPININAGAQYNFNKRFFARAGVSSASSSPYAGAGVSWNNFRLDVSASYHPQLGISPGLMLIINFKAPETSQQ